MLSRENNELLTQTGPGSPCGQFMRRFWHPVALSEELLPGAPVPLRIMGEDYVLFRDEQGRAGLLDIHCAHRGADLSYGRLEDGGLRCIYHGWLYDVNGRCLEQPGEPAGSTFCDKVRQPAYPVVERSDTVWAYLGPGAPPPFPDYEFLTVPPENVSVAKVLQECNFQQANEGNIDYLHLSFLHFTQGMDRGDQTEAFSSRGAAPWRETVEGEPVPAGLRVCRIRELDDARHLYMGTYIMPSAFAFYGFNAFGGVPEGYSLNWHVPIDDVTHWKFMFSFSRLRTLDKEQFKRRFPISADYRLELNLANRYRQDRSGLPADSYSGIATFVGQDACVTEGAGPIQDRTREHLGISDVVVIDSRHLMLDAIKAVQRGEPPPPAPEAVAGFGQTFVWSGMVDKGTDWRAFFRDMDRTAGKQLAPGAV